MVAYSQDIKTFTAFSFNECDAMVNDPLIMLSRFVKNKKPRLKRLKKKRMPAEDEEVDLSSADKTKRCNCMFEAVDRFPSEAE